MSTPVASIKVWGEFAMFTRPELKVERLSYPLMTPSAARGAGGGSLQAADAMARSPHHGAQAGISTGFPARGGGDAVSPDRHSPE